MTTFENKQFYQTSIASAQRTPTEGYYQTGESFFKKKIKKLIFLCISLNCENWISIQCEKETLLKCHLRNLTFQLSFPHFSPNFSSICWSKDCLQPQSFHRLQPAASSPEAGNSSEASCPFKLCVNKLQHLPSVHQCPTTVHPHLLLQSWFLVQIQCFSHNILG